MLFDHHQHELIPLDEAGEHLQQVPQASSRQRLAWVAGLVAVMCLGLILLLSPVAPKIDVTKRLHGSKVLQSVGLADNHGKDSGAQCPTGTVYCPRQSGNCISASSLLFDNGNCGKCENKCDPFHVCISGICSLTKDVVSKLFRDAATEGTVIQRLTDQQASLANDITAIKSSLASLPTSQACSPGLFYDPVSGTCLIVLAPSSGVIPASCLPQNGVSAYGNPISGRCVTQDLCPVCMTGNPVTGLCAYKWEWTYRSTDQTLLRWTDAANNVLLTFNPTSTTNELFVSRFATRGTSFGTIVPGSTVTVYFDVAGWSYTASSGATLNRAAVGDRTILTLFAAVNFGSTTVSGPTSPAVCPVPGPGPGKRPP